MTKERTEMANEGASGVDKTTALRTGVIGVLLIIVGVVNDITGIIFLWQSNSELDGVFLRRAHGIWSGVLLLIAGFLGILVWVKVEETLVKVFTAINIFVVIMFFVQLIMVAVIVGTFDNYTQAKAKCRVTMNDCNCNRLLLYYQERCDHYPWALKMFVGILLCTLFGLVVSIIASIIGCVGVRQGAGKPSIVLHPRSSMPGTLGLLPTSSTLHLNVPQDQAPSANTLQRQKSPKMFLAVEPAKFSAGQENRGQSDIDV